MANFTRPIDSLIENLSRLPGVGPKTAQRLAFYIINMPQEDVKKLSESIASVKQGVKFCSSCCNITDTDPCPICSDEKRDKSIICVVESPKDVIQLERTKEYHGLYHVLHGTISPAGSVTPDMLKIKELVTRMADDNIKEVILATNPTIDGEATAMYIARLLSPFEIRVTRIARGLPMGSDIEYADEVTITKALENRMDVFSD
ncbi:recombination mediator RecR [Criibacterium bergeronii]|uniref:Recombination protein RecR n=1 Tax=Criibacterium bergeronii TaxID=1871336 RepID=A0A371IJ16_9FIRM|nr:recombination mediator RecR [Criibacterium bergeronii]MBS6063338.1 recombination mediator RecR [Peptostreptococcaceae bacterium]RDY20468.1 recombination protein RecR [Criibacterium bergeronii]